MLQLSLIAAVVLIAAAAPPQTAPVPLEFAAAASLTAQASGQDAPPVWIGVRMSPVPAPLAAHLSREGLMVDNIVADSPADRAGLERYDVLVSFAGRELQTGDDLVDAIVANGADKPAELVIIRGGRERTIEITPIERPRRPKFAFKYDEPAPLAEDEALRYFGHALRVGPDGRLEFQPLGRMKDLPPWLDEHLWGDAWSMAPNDHGTGALGWPFGSAFTFRFGGAGGPEGAFELSFRIEENGKSLAVERDKDGAFTVTREQNGAEQSATYASEEQFRQEDPEAYERYRRHVRSSGSIHVVPPAIDRLPDLQHDFDEQLRDIQQRVQEALDKARESHRALRRRAASRDTQDAIEQSLSIRITPDGCVVELEEDGARRRYEFDDLDHLRRSDPALYERCRPLLDDLEGEARSQARFSYASAA